MSNVKVLNNYIVTSNIFQNKTFKIHFENQLNVSRPIAIKSVYSKKVQVFFTSFICLKPKGRTIREGDSKLI